MAHNSHTILIADDVRDTREMLSTALKMQNIRTLEAADGNAAVEIALTEKPDLILMDLQMPECDGFEAAAELQQHTETKDIPVIAVSAYCFDFDWHQKAVQCGCTICIDKPFKLETLNQAIRHYLPDIA